ncbi:MAG TPA: hypothetical protein VF477_19285 [Mycobacterium sp.]
MTQVRTKRQEQVELLRGEIDVLRELIEGFGEQVDDVRVAAVDGFSEMQRVSRASRLHLYYVNLSAAFDTMRRQFDNLHPLLCGEGDTRCPDCA